MGEWRLADMTLLSFFFAAILAAESQVILDNLRALSPTIPAWLAAEYHAAVSPADPEEGQR